MSNKRAFVALGALIIGALGGYVFSTHRAQRAPVMNHQINIRMEAEMASMTGALSGKTGDAFDAAFLSEMTMHHQGAVQMAELALQNARHQEIKDLAKAIIAAQKSEIAQMRDWQATWYGSSSGN